MISFGKKIIGIIGIGFLVLWGVSWGLDIVTCKELEKNVDGKCVSCADPNVCCGSKLNTNVPFIGKCVEFDIPCQANSGCYDNPDYTCIKGTCKANTSSSDKTHVSQGDAFPILMGGLTRLLLTIIVLTGFIVILAGGVMIAAAGSDDGRAKNGRKMIMSVVIAFAILGASGVILRLINPNFFK